MSRFIPEGPVEYVIFRLQGCWDLNEVVCRKIATELYLMKNPDAQTIALQLDELEDEQVALILPYLPSEITTHLDDIPL